MFKNAKFMLGNINPLSDLITPFFACKSVEDEWEQIPGMFSAWNREKERWNAGKSGNCGNFLLMYPNSHYVKFLKYYVR